MHKFVLCVYKHLAHKFVIHLLLPNFVPTLQTNLESPRTMHKSREKGQRKCKHIPFYYYLLHLSRKTLIDNSDIIYQCTLQSMHLRLYSLLFRGLFSLFAPRVWCECSITVYHACNNYCDRMSLEALISILHLLLCLCVRMTSLLLN